MAKKSGIEIKGMTGKHSLTAAMNRLGGEPGRLLVHKAVKKIGFDLMKDVMYASPVDTGRYRAAWSAIFGRYGKDRKLGVPNFQGKTGKEDKAMKEGVSKGKSRWSRRQTELTLINPVDYAVALEYGERSPHQGRVSKAIANFQSTVPFKEIQVDLMNDIAREWAKD